MSTLYKSRCKKVLSLLQAQKIPSALLISPNPSIYATHDNTYGYVPNADLFYLTGSRSPTLSLLIRSDVDHKESLILVTPPHNPIRVLWEGAEVEPPSTVAKRIGATLLESKDMVTDICTKLSKTRQLYYQNIPNTTSSNVAEKFFSRPVFQRGLSVSSLTQADVLLAPLRMIKTAEEIAFIKRAAKVTHDSLVEAITLIEPGILEGDIAAAIDYGFTSRGATPAFQTIVASGPSAAVLHYTKGTRKIRDGELLLIDCGARLDMYCADITRMYPVSGETTPMQQSLLEVVAAAQEEAINTIRPGVRILDVYRAAAKVLWSGLKSLRICKLPFEKSLKEKEITKYFPHGIGHSLGIDVHDVVGHQDSKEMRFEVGMVFTVEPGLYFPKSINAAILPLGIRLEEDIVVTKKGAQVLTDYIP
jgi:Xaa-Pro aminopeptidase